MNTIIILLWCALGAMVLWYGYYYGFKRGFKKGAAKAMQEYTLRGVEKYEVLLQTISLAELLTRRIKNTDFGYDSEKIRAIMYQMIAEESEDLALKTKEMFKDTIKTTQKMVKKRIK